MKRSPMSPGKKEVNRPKFTLAFGVLVAIGFVTLLQVFFVFFKSHHTTDHNRSVISHKNYRVNGNKSANSANSVHLWHPANKRPAHITQEPNLHKEQRNYSAELPKFTSDESDIILSSLIERESDSWNLHLTAFFLSTAMVDPSEVRQYKVIALSFYSCNV